LFDLVERTVLFFFFAHMIVDLRDVDLLTSYSIPKNFLLEEDSLFVSITVLISRTDSKMVPCTPTDVSKIILLLLKGVLTFHFKSACVHVEDQAWIPRKIYHQNVEYFSADEEEVTQAIAWATKLRSGLIR